MKNIVLKVALVDVMDLVWMIAQKLVQIDVPQAVHLIARLHVLLIVMEGNFYAPNYHLHCHSRLPAEVQILLSRWKKPSRRNVGKNCTSGGGLCLATSD